jgi:hypothetical protein
MLQLPLLIADVPCFGSCSQLVLQLVLEGKLRVKKLLLGALVCADILLQPGVALLSSGALAVATVLRVLFP